MYHAERLDKQIEGANFFSLEVCSVPFVLPHTTVVHLVQYKPRSYTLYILFHALKTEDIVRNG